MQAAAPLLQHDAPIFLGSLSSWAGGCTTRCNDPATFRYIATGEGVTVYIVDGVRSIKLTLLVSSSEHQMVVVGRSYVRWYGLAQRMRLHTAL